MSILDHVWGESPAADRVWAKFAGMRPSLIPRLRLMVLQAYIDDSRDDASGTFVLAGYVASVEQWAAFSRDWAKLLPLAGKNKKGEHRFKMSQMAWHNKMKEVSLFHKVIMEHAQMSIACIVNIKSLRAKVDNLVATAELPHGEVELEIESFKAKWRDPSFFCFRAIMDTIPKLQIERPDMMPVDGIIDFWFDNDEANEGYVRSVWDEYLSFRDPKYRDLYGGKPMFGDKERYLPLQAADFRAWWVRRWAMEYGPERIAEGNYDFDQGEKKMYHLTLWADEEQISKNVADALGNGMLALVNRGQKLQAKQPLMRYWPPTKPL